MSTWMTYYCIIVNTNYLSNYAILLYDVGSLRLTPIMCAQTLAVVEFISNSLISLYDGAWQYTSVHLRD